MLIFKSNEAHSHIKGGKQYPSIFDLLLARQKTMLRLVLSTKNILDFWGKY